MRQFNTLTGFLLSKSSNPTTDDTVEFQGYAAIGDGGNATWKHNGVTAQPVSQSPAQLGDALLNDGSGNQWALIIKREVNARSLGDSLSGLVVQAAFNAAKALAAPIGGEYPSDEQVTLYFPSGRYNTNGSNIILNIGVTGLGIRGDGNMSQLDNISLEMAGAYGCTFQSFLMRGSAGYGIKSNSDVSEVNRSNQNLFSDLYIKGKTTGIIFDGSGGNRWSDVFVEESAGNGLEVIETNGEQVSNCYSMRNGESGLYIAAGGELKFVNFLTMGNQLYGIHLFANDASATVLEHYFNNVTATRQAITRVTDITSIINSGGNIQVTSADHKLAEGMIDIGIGGTSVYDAEEAYTVLSVIDDDNVVLSATYISDVTVGKIKLRNWDFFVDCDSTNRAKINDIFVHGGNFNYTRVKSGFNIQFNNTRLKQQFYMDGDSAIVMRKGSARGRQDSTFKNIPASGNTEGLIEDIYGTVSGSSSPAEGQAIRKIGDTTITQTATALDLEAGGTTITIDADGLISSGVIEVGTFNVINRSTATISGGVITAETGYIILDTEGAAASDDLDTINGGQKGYELRIQSVSGSRQTTLKDGTGNLALAGDFTLTNPRDSITLIYSTTTNEWVEYSRSDNQ